MNKTTSKSKQILAFILAVLCALGFLSVSPRAAHAAGLTSATPSSYIIIGDSRTVHMAGAVSSMPYQKTNAGTAYDSAKKTRYSAKSGEGLKWMKNYGVPNIQKHVGQNTAVIIWMGTNDVTYGKPADYVSYIKSQASSWIKKGARVYFATVGGAMKGLNNTKINQFNSSVTNGLKGSGVQIIDIKGNVTNGWNWSYYASDGIHYQNSGSKAVYNYIISQVKADFKKAYQPDKVITGGFTDIENGVYTIQSAINKSFVLDVPNGSKSNSVQMQLYKSNNTNAQKFRIERIGKTGYYKVTNIGSGKALDVKGAVFSSGRPVQQYTPNGTNAQQWIIKKNGNGTYTFLSKVNGLAMDVPSAAAKNNAKMQLYKANNTKAQQFHLAKVG